MSKKNNTGEGVFGGDVGYKNPPKSGQFQAGRSGNPKGRPKKERDPVHDMVERIFFAEQPVKIAGKEKKMRGIEIVLVQLMQKAQKGEEKSARFVFSLLDKYGFPEEKFEIIPPFVPSRGELAEHYRDELEEEENSD